MDRDSFHTSAYRGGYVHHAYNRTLRRSEYSALAPDGTTLRGLNCYRTESAARAAISRWILANRGAA